MLEYTIPLIVRGRIIEDNLVRFEARRGVVAFQTPDINQYIDEIVLKDPSKIGDLYDVSLDEIVDYLVELGPRLSPDTNPYIAQSLDIAVHTSGLKREQLYGAYAALSSSLNRTFLRDIIEQNIGSRYLEGWDSYTLHDREIAVRAFGSRIVHLNAGNSPILTLFAVINGSILRCDNIIKSPSNDPFTMFAIVKTMIEMAPDHPITRHFTVGYWKGGDVEFEKRLYGGGAIDKIVAWGGMASMQSIRGYIGPGLDLIALDPKISGSIIGAEALASEASMDEAAERLAMDFGAYNQEGCVSSRVAYVVSGTGDEDIDRLNKFGKKVLAALKALPSTLSTPHPSFDAHLKEEIDGIRYSDSYRVFGCKENEGGVIVSQTNDPVDFRDYLGGRVVNLVPLDHVDQALDHVTVHTQTLGVYPASLKTQIRDRCLLHGAQRITDLGCAVGEGMANPHDAIELLRRMARWGVMESFTPEVIKAGAGFVISDEQRDSKKARTESSEAVREDAAA
ncbi:acyl-CoA reductase [Sphingobium sp. AN558]|uniref:acyl-CoA reductase n=1 Tax=Sphingobium sp. AN558 TaxID=3133442 RepID=UPI0030C30470